MRQQAREHSYSNVINKNSFIPCDGGGAGALARIRACIRVAADAGALLDALCAANAALPKAAERPCRAQAELPPVGALRARLPSLAAAADAEGKNESF